MTTIKYLFILLSSIPSIIEAQPKMIVSNEIYSTYPFGFSQAVITDNLIFASGMVGWNENYELTGDDFKSQVEQTFINLELLLNANNGDFENILHIRFYVVALDELKLSVIADAMKKRYLNAYRPATTLIGIDRLAREKLKIEIEITAKK